MYAAAVYSVALVGWWTYSETRSETVTVVRKTGVFVEARNALGLVTRREFAPANDIAHVSIVESMWRLQVVNVLLALDVNGKVLASLFCNVRPAADKMVLLRDRISHIILSDKQG